MPSRTQPAVDYGRLSDLELAERCARRNRQAVEHVIRANNQRLFRAAWSILRHRAEAEDAVQAAYLSAFASIGAFEGRSALSTWLTRIAVNEALGRKRAEQARRHHLEQEGIAMLDVHRESITEPGPDAALAREQIRRRLEQAVSALPDPYRTVFVLREIEGLSGEEAANALDLAVATVKTRLFRARRQLRQALAPDLSSLFGGAFPFAGQDCAALTERVLDRLGV